MSDETVRIVRDQDCPRCGYPETYADVDARFPAVALVVAIGCTKCGAYLPQDRPLKVRVTLTVEVDPEAWYDTYGRDPREDRTEVREYVREQVQGSAAADEGCIVAVTLK